MPNWNCTVVASAYLPRNFSCTIYEGSGSDLLWADGVECVSDSCSATVFENRTIDGNSVNVGTGSSCANSSPFDQKPIVSGVCLPTVPSVRPVAGTFWATTISIAAYSTSDSACVGSMVSLGTAATQACLPFPNSSDFFSLYQDLSNNIYLLRYSNNFCFTLLSTTKVPPASPCVSGIKFTITNSTNQGFEVDINLSSQNVTQSISYSPTYTTCAASSLAKCYKDATDFNLTTYALQIFGPSEPFFIQTIYIQSPNEDCSAGAKFQNAVPLYQCSNNKFNWLMNDNATLVVSNYGGDGNCQGSPTSAMQFSVNSCSYNEYQTVFNLDA
ncbi:hypothetical protein HK100_007489 [Physocladia obscura]|uniref:Uncharacterized protein n=1 Tax=Physocladia obscura TaxID=109957 RepID=A0AAD5SNV9_9FUNG|nr:hypothetical protein HK100_007489 [Physocladia obscura]